MQSVAEEDIEVRDDGKEYSKRSGRRVYRIEERSPNNRRARRRRAQEMKRKPLGQPVREVKGSGAQ